MLQQRKTNPGAEFPGHMVTLCLTKNWKTFPNWQLYFLSSPTVCQSPSYPHVVTNTSNFKFEGLSTNFEFKKQMAVTCRDNPSILCPVSKGLLRGSVLSGLLLVARHSLERAPCPVCSSPRQMPHNSGTSNTLSSPTPLECHTMNGTWPLQLPVEEDSTAPWLLYPAWLQNQHCVDATTEFSCQVRMQQSVLRHFLSTCWKLSWVGSFPGFSFPFIPTQIRT